MNILVIGSGAREHAILWKLRQSPLVDLLYCAPGNAGTASLAMNLPVKATDIDGLLRAAADRQIDLTVVGPEQPLMLGIVDRFEEAGLRTFGPSRAAAELEGSKVFAKQFMQKYGIPTAAFRAFRREEYEEAVAFIRALDGRVVVKADGLAAGKGVIVCSGSGEAMQALEAIMQEKIFGDAGSAVVLEEYLDGEEASVLVLTDGESFLTLPPSQDHKRIFDNDQGKNTGGMGAYAPVPAVTPGILEEVHRTIIRPTLDGMRREGRTYRGCLYAGIMLTARGPKVIEFNCRFGDPETEVVLPLLDDDLAALMLQIAAGRLETEEIRWKDHSAVTVVIASGGYPDEYETGKNIRGLDAAEHDRDVVVFHAGTAFHGDAIVTAGGRVLAVTAAGPSGDLEGTIARAYDAVKKITFDGAYYRGDIGRKGVAALHDSTRGKYP